MLSLKASTPIDRGPPFFFNFHYITARHFKIKKYNMLRIVYDTVEIIKGST